MINAAIVGLGRWGRMHVSSDAGSDRLRYTRAVDAVPDAVREFAAEFELPLGDDYADVLADPAIDAVVLATPHSQHTDQIVAAAAAGKHVLSEKPFALDLADARRAIAAVTDAGITLSIGHNMRFDAVFAAAKAMIDAGELGALVHLEANYSHDVLPTIEGWRRTSAEAPAGGLVHMGIHMIDLFNYLAGPMVEVYGQMSSRVIEDDQAALLARFAGGATGYICNLTATPASAHFQVFGADGWVRRDGFDRMTICRKGGEPEVRTLAARDIPAQIRANDENFAAAITGEAEPMFSPASILHETAVLDAVIRSLDSRRPEAVK